MLDEVQFIRDKHGEVVSPYDASRTFLEDRGVSSAFDLFTYALPFLLGFACPCRITDHSRGRERYGQRCRARAWPLVVYNLVESLYGDDEGVEG